MRKQAKVLANFLGATKELTSGYVELAGITDNELNQIAFTVMQRADRKETARLLAAKGLPTRKIAELTGWSHQTIMRDLGPNGPKIGPKRTKHYRSRSQTRASSKCCDRGGG